MKIVINVVHAQCILCYFGYFLQLMLELLFIIFILDGLKMIHMLNLTHALKQQFTNINGKSQTN